MPTLEQSTTFYADGKWIMKIDRGSIEFNVDNQNALLSAETWKRVLEELRFFGHFQEGAV